MSATDGAPSDSRTLREYVRVLRRHKLILIASLVVVPALALVFSLHQQRLYSASARVYLSFQNLASELNNTGPNQGPTEDANRLTQTQAELATSTLVAQRTLTAAHLSGRSMSKFLSSSSVTPATNADFLLFSVRDPNPATAVKLANQYARQFTIYRLELSTVSLASAQREVQSSLGVLSPAQRHSALYTSLIAKLQQLKTLEALQTSNAFLVTSGEAATKVQPKPVRNVIFGLILGLILGVALAFLREALDTRIAGSEELEELLDLPLLARVPEPPRNLKSRDQLAMLADPGSMQAEAFRMLRANLEFATLSRETQLIMVSSAIEAEGKSTTFANLAVAMARAGKHVVLADLDLRRPYIHHFFGLEVLPGVTDVVLGRVSLGEALAEVDIAEEGAGAGSRTTMPLGRLEVLPCGSRPPNIGEFVGTDALGELLASLRERADIVFIDAPPMLQVGDAMTLSAKVDAMMVVVKLDSARRPTLKELQRLLHVSPAAKLGYVLTGTSPDQGYYGAGTYYGTGATATLAESHTESTS
jgi:tyrosine-protein kinase